MRTGTEQYVILGAGLDTFAFREPEFMKKYMVYELDHPKTQADKIQRIDRAGLDIPQNLIFVGVDFTKDDLCEMLLSAGFDNTKKTFFSWLGVSYYLFRDDIEKMLKSIASIAADGSTLLFDYADAGLFLSDEKRVQNMVAMAKAGGEEMKSSFDYWSMEQMLSNYGFLIYEILEPKDIQTRIIGKRGMKAFEHINYVQAVIKKTTWNLTEEVMAFDFKKEYKEFYMPKNKPQIVNVPKANYIAVRGKGNPNEEGGAYQQAISVLYAVAYTLKMSYKTDYKIEGFFEYVVPPLEGFWWQDDVDSVDYSDSCFCIRCGIPKN